MMTSSVFKLNLNETFPRLTRPPIVEAVINWQARAQHMLEPESLRMALISRLPEYPLWEPIQHVTMQAMVANQAARPVVKHPNDWQGFRLTSLDHRDMIQFTRDGVAFSRRLRYDDWVHFAIAAKQVWQVFAELAEPVEIERLGVRFINHLARATPESLGEILREPPTCPSNLPLKEFIYQSIFSVPEEPFDVRIIKVLQPATLGMPQSSGLFINCDVFTTRSIACDELGVNEALTKMRWLKNKVFFSLLTESAIQSLA